MAISDTDRSIESQTLSGSVDNTRVLLRFEGGALMLVAFAFYLRTGENLGRFAVLFLVPDLSMLFYVFGARAGASAYNAMHSTLAPLILAVAGLAAAHGELVAFALIWLCHIGFDRALGYGLKRPSGFRDTHIGRIGALRQD